MWEWKRADLRRIRTRWVVALVLALGAALSFGPGARAWAGLELTPHFGFNDTLAAGDWAPARLLVINDVDPAKPKAALRDFTGSLRLTVTDFNGKSVRYEQALELPQKTRKVVEFPVMLGIGQIQAQLINSRGSVVLTRSLGPLMNPGANQRLEADQGVRPTALIAQETEESVRTPPGIGPWVNTQKIPYEEIPSDSRSLQSVRAVIVSRRLSSRLTPEQLGALDQWIREGGVLMVMAPRRASEIKLDPWLNERMPAAVGETALVPATDLDPDAGAAGQVTLAAWGERAPGAEVLWSSSAGPLALGRWLGLGRVVVFALDPGELPPAMSGQKLALEAMSLIESIMLSPREDLRARHQFSTQNLDPKFTGVSLLPQIGVVLVFLGAFMLVVGPLNFYILRRRNRLELAWVTIPALSIVFFLLIYAYGKTLRTDRQLQASAEILHLASGERDGLLLWNTIQFSPSAQTYSFTLPRPGAVQPALTFYQPTMSMWQQMGLRPGLQVAENRPAVVRQDLGAPFTLENYVPFGVMAFYMGESPMSVEEGITVNPVVSGDGSVRLTVRNPTKTTLTDVRLAVGELEYRVGDITAGATLETQLPPASGNPQVQNTLMNAQQVAWQMAQQQQRQRFGGQSPNPGPSAGAKFEDMTADLIRQGANQGFPIQIPFRTQSRVRLTAGQEGWKSDVTIAPAPAVHQTAGMVEIETALALQGEVTFGARQTSTDTTPIVMAARRDIYSYDWDKTRFNDPSMAGGLATLNDGSLEVLYGPPSLVGPVRLVSGAIQASFVENGETAELEIFDYANGRWAPVAVARPTGNPGPRGQGQIVTASIPVAPENINPHGHYARLRVRSVPGSAGGGVFQNWGGRGVHFQSLNGQLTFAPGHTE